MLRASRLNGGSLFVAAAVLFLVNLNSSPVGAQLGIDTQNAAGDLCECSPACEGDVGTSLGGLGCRGRMMARADCPCCKVCAQDKGAECSHPALPCDTEFGLVCSPEGICKAEYSCQGDGECPEDRFCLGGVCVDPCPILTPCHGALKGGVCVSKAHRPVCQCPNGTIANSAGDVCVPINGTAEEVELAKEEETTLQEDEAFADEIMTTPIPAVQLVETMAEGENVTEGEMMAEDKGEKMAGVEKKAVDEKTTESKKMVEGEKLAEGDEKAEGEKKAVVVEYNSEGEEIHRITVNEQIEVVTVPGQEIIEMTTTAGGTEEITEQPVSEGDEGMATEAAPEEPLEVVVAPSAREGKMAPEEDVGNTGEDEISLQEKDSLSKSSSGGLKVLNVTHNTSAIVLPSTKGGEIYYRSSGGQEWLRESVEAGQDSVVLRGLVPRTQYTLKWSGASGGSAKITIDTGDGCQVKNVSYGVAQEWSEGCQRRCSCRPDGSPDCQPRCLFVAGDIEDPTCIERPAPEDPECCVVYDCTKADSPAVPPILKEEQKPGQPKLLVTQESHNSVTLAWDDFRAKRNEGGYVIEYREADEASLSEDAVGLEDKEWMRKELPTVSPISSFTVQDLKPNTIYQVRVSIYGDSDDTRLGDSTETLTVRTDPGCIYRNTSYPVGEFFVGCEEGCMCLISGDTKCFERCSLPYFRAGAFKDDPKCREQPTNRDECCVTVQCFTTQNTTFSTCSNVVCGANAKCVASDGFSLSEFDREVTLGYCRCLEGFVGDASDLQTGCVPDPSTDHKEGVCTYKNNTYSPGEVFFDDCEYRCSCTKSTEIECEPRCEFPYEAGSKAEPGCEYIPDPEDFCCKLHVCNSTSEAATNAARSPSLISDGCTENNVTYAKNEKFYKGCETQCICMGFGDVSCFPRCPPSKVVSKTPKRCETLPDPLDSCCSITVCDEETPDVMKANITEMEKEMMLMKEKMKNMTEMEKDMLMKRMSELEKEMMMKNISDMETILQHLIEKKNELLHSDISEVEKEMIRNNMTEIEMLMKAVAEMEQEIMRPDLTDTEKIILKRKLIEMQKSMEEMMANGEIDEHTRMHLLGIEHSHFHDSENHFHDSENRTHTHDDGTTHSHPDGHLPHLHGDMDNHTHTHADGTTHSHPGGHLPHTHDDMDNFTHTHEDGTTHSHPVGNLSHSHDDMDNHTHTHEDGTTHSHPGGNLPHTNDDMDNFTHTHEDGTTHSHPGGNLPHTHDDMDNFTHTHEDGTTHSHPVGNLSHSHDDMDNHTHTHEDGTTHSHPEGHLPHSHDDMDNHTHTHADGTTHSHPGGNLSHSHDMETAHSHTLATDNDHNHTHTHEDGTVHSHPHDHNDESLNHTHLDEEHDHMNGTHDHTHNMGEEHDHVHTHEDGTTHSHPHGHMDDTHNHVHDMDDGHNHTHTHEDGTTHSHPHDHMDGAHNHTHMNEDNEMHPREEIGEFHNQTVFSGLDKKNRAEDLGTHHLNILSVVPINATTVEMRVGVSDSVMSQLLSGKDESVKVLYSPDSLTWMEKNISIGDINIENGEEMVMYIGNLQPSTPYQFRISYREHVSSTSKARLLDGASDLGFVVEATSRLDCIAGTSFVEETKCGRHCICGENYEVMCKPRCPAINLPEDIRSHCPMVPNPDDPCCRVPDCLLEIYARFGNGTFSEFKGNGTKLEDILNGSRTKNQLEEMIRNGGIRPENEQSDLDMRTNATGKVSVDSMDNRHGNTSQPEHKSHWNTIFPHNRGPGAVDGGSLDSIQDPHEFSEQYDQAGNASDAGSFRDGSPFVTNTSQIYKQNENEHVHIVGEEGNGAYLPTDESQKGEDDHNLINHESAVHALQNASSLHPDLRISVVHTTSGPELTYLANDDKNEVGSFPGDEEHGLHFKNDESDWNPSLRTSQFDDHHTPFSGSTSTEGFIVHEHENSYLPLAGENDFQEPREDVSLHLPVVDRENAHHWDENESNKNTPVHSHTNLPDEHETSLLPKTKGDLQPQRQDEVTHELPSRGETSHHPSENQNPYYLPTSTGKPSFTDDGLPLFSLIPPSSHNEADVTSRNKDLLEAGIDIDPSVMCSRNGRYYKPSEEFYEGCTRSCICSSNLEIHCADIECPVTFGLELVDPNCLEWDVDKDYVPTPPKCCAQVTCIASAACDYMGQKFNNYDTIPRELTGCSKVCTCNYGNVTCRDLCDPIPPIPPPELNCASEDAVRITLPGETCCETWQCAAHTVGGTPVVFPLPPESVLNGTPTSGFIPIHPSHTSLQFGEDELIPRPHIQSLDAYTAQLMFSTPSHYQDLPGELVIRYTNDSINQPDPEMWTREVIVPPGTRISNTKWEYKLHNLEPNTQYTMQLMLSVFDSDPVTSPLFTYTTMPEASTPPTTTPLARLDIDPELHASEITKTSAKVSWRIFNDYELQYIDGVQIKYTAKDKLIPKFSQLFHRDNDQMDLRGLQPGNTYTVELVFITHKNQTTQVSSIHPITFQTLPEEDVYAFDIIVTAGKVSTQTAELFYSGVPEPEEKYVNVYRAVYLREDERIDAQAFKIPKTGQEKKIFLSELKPDIEYQVWLEAFLSNGRKKKSNVITITTRAGQLPKPERSEVDPSVADNKEVDGYYPALVAVAIIAAIACVGFLGLLIILLRKQSHAKAHINSSKNNAAYDNPSYRVGDNGYEMEMNGIRGGSNGATHVEDP